jgi:hypothetical protein
MMQQKREARFQLSGIWFLRFEGRKRKYKA